MHTMTGLLKPLPYIARTVSSNYIAVTKYSGAILLL